MNTGTDLIDEIADEAFLKMLSKLIDTRLKKEIKKVGARKCTYCGKRPGRPRFLQGSNYCQVCYENGNGAGGFDY